MQQRALFLPSLFVSAFMALAACSAAAADNALPEDEKLRAQALTERQQVRDAARQEIARQRAELAAWQQREESVCYQKFAVESCLSKVRNEVRDAEKPLRAKELQINDEERKERSSERLRSIEKKVNEPRTPAPMQATPRQPLTKQGSPSERTLDDVARDRAARDAEAQQRAQSQQQRVDAHRAENAARVQSEAERRAKEQADAQQRQEEAQKRRERRDKAVSERTGAPLPLPPGMTPE